MFQSEHPRALWDGTPTESAGRGGRGAGREVYAQKLQLESRELGPDGRQIPGLLTPLWDFQFLVFTGTEQRMRRWRTNRPVLSPGDRVQQPEGGGEAVGTGKLEQSQVSFCRLDGTASGIPQTNSPALSIGSHICTVPMEPPSPSRQATSPLYVSVPCSASDMPVTCTPWQWFALRSLFFSPLLFFHDSIKNYDSLQEVKAFFKDGLSQEQPCTPPATHSFGADISRGPVCHGGDLGERQWGRVPKGRI